MIRRAVLSLVSLGLLAMLAFDPVRTPIDAGVRRIGRAVATPSDLKNPAPECLSDGFTSLTIDWTMEPAGRRMDRVGAVRALLRGLRFDDVIERYWDEDQQKPFVRVLRHGQTVMLVSFGPDSAGGWWADTFTWCTGSEGPVPIYP